MQNTSKIFNRLFLVQNFYEHPYTFLINRALRWTDRQTDKPTNRCNDITSFADVNITAAGHLCDVDDSSTCRYHWISDFHFFPDLLLLLVKSAQLGARFYTQFQLTLMSFPSAGCQCRSVRVNRLAWQVYWLSINLLT